MIVASTLMFKTMESETANVIPQWLPAIGIIVAGFGAGFGAMFTNTTSAYIVRFVGTAAGFAVILHTIFQ